MRKTLTARQLYEAIRGFMGPQLDSLIASVSSLDPGSVPKLKRAFLSTFSEIRKRVMEVDLQLKPGEESVKVEDEYKIVISIGRTAYEIYLFAIFVFDEMETKFSGYLSRHKELSVH